MLFMSAAGAGWWGRHAGSHVWLGCAGASSPHPGDAKGGFDGDRSCSHAREEPGVLVELGAGWGDAGILLEGLKVGRERKNSWRMTSSKRGFPYDILWPMPRQR